AASPTWRATWPVSTPPSSPNSRRPIVSTKLSHERVSDKRLASLRDGLNVWTSAGRSSQPQIDADICAALTELQQRRAADGDVHRCFMCAQPFKAGQMVLPDVNEGLGHR